MKARILQIPCNTQYVKKLQKEGILEITNGADIGTGESIPMEVTFQWVLQHKEDVRFWQSFDIAHIHFGFEFEDLEVVKEALDILRNQKKPVVYTYHEPCSVHGISQESYSKYVQVLLNSAVEVITLTDVAREYLRNMYSRSDVVVIPHGYVESPNINIPDNRSVEMPEVLLFGALRPNRDTATTMMNLAFGKLGCKVSLVTRPFSYQQLNESSLLRTMLASVSSCSHVSIELTLPMTDDEVRTRICKADILVLPYVFGGHSGQFEHAFDCGVLPVVTDVGFIQTQTQFWRPIQTDGAVIVNWSDSRSWLYQVRLVQGVRQAIRQLSQFRSSLDMEARKTYRTAEHEFVLASHCEVYSRSIKKFRKEQLV